ncbi:unnamed protein product, partial [Phaeothamnion confervicola]
YRSIVGSLVYAAYVTHVDIANAVRILARFMSAPMAVHMAAAKRCLRYLAGTRSLGIVHRRAAAGTRPVLTGYSDADMTSNFDNGRSTTGVIFQLAGGAVSFSSRLQRPVARSPMEVECVALFEAAQTSVLLRGVLEHICGDLPAKPTVIREDNLSGTTASMAPVRTRHSRHICIRYRRLREQIRNRTISVVSIVMAVQLTDCLTKNLEASRHGQLRQQLMD